jgi:peroxiredoxin
MHMKKLIYLLSVIIISAAAQAQYKVGDTAMDFNLKNIDGKMVSLSSMNNVKGYIVIFTCNHCPYSKAYEDRIIELDKKYKAKGYPVVAINPNDPKVSPDDSYELMKVRAKEKKFTFPYLYDNTQEIAKTYGATRTPHVFILQKTKNGNVVEYIGAIDNNTESASDASSKYVEEAVNALLVNSKPSTNVTKAIGCTIKWRKDS